MVAMGDVVQPTLSSDKTAGQGRRTDPRKHLSSRGVWVWLCTDCDHPASDHRMRGDWRVEPRIFACVCGCEKPEGAKYAPLSRAGWQTWLDRHPGWVGR